MTDLPSPSDSDIVTGPSLGTARFGETLVPIHRIDIEPGAFVLRCSLPGPVAADSGFPVIYGPDGRECFVGACRMDWDTVPLGVTLVLTYVLNIALVTAAP